MSCRRGERLSIGRRRGATRFGPLVLAVSALALSACGSASDPAGTAVGAAHKTAALSWVRYQIQFTRSHLFPPAIGVTGARGAFDFRTGLNYAFIGVRRRSGGPENVFVDSSAKAFAVAPSPAPAGLLPPGKSWISAPFPGRQGAGPLAAQVEGLGPLLALDEIKWGAQTGSSLGTRAVGHVPMSEYEVTVDLAKARSAALAHGDGAVAAAIDRELRASRSGRVKLDVWVNGPGYIAKIYGPVPGSRLGTTSLTFSSYTEPYGGSFPPPSEITSLASLNPGRRSIWTVAAGP
jgi:hypothetical protein